MPCKTVSNQEYVDTSTKGCPVKTTPITICISSDNVSNISCSLNNDAEYGPISSSVRKYWQMELQRKKVGSSSWYTIGTRTGYVAKGDQSHRTFTNVAKVPGAMYRVVVYWGGANGCPIKGTPLISPYITH